MHYALLSGISRQNPPFLAASPILARRPWPHTDHLGLGVSPQTSKAKQAGVYKGALGGGGLRGTPQNEGMTPKPKPLFDPKLFLAKVGKGRTISEYHKNQVVFSQGEPGDAIFYIYKGKGSAAIFSKRSYSSSIDLSTMKAEGCKEAICTVL